MRRLVAGSLLLLALAALLFGGVPDAGRGLPNAVADATPVPTNCPPSICGTPHPTPSDTTTSEPTGNPTSNPTGGATKTPRASGKPGAGGSSSTGPSAAPVASISGVPQPASTNPAFVPHAAAAAPFDQAWPFDPPPPPSPLAPLLSKRAVAGATAVIAINLALFWWLFSRRRLARP